MNHRDGKQQLTALAVFHDKAQQLVCKKFDGCYAWWMSISHIETTPNICIKYKPNFCCINSSSSLPIATVLITRYFHRQHCSYAWLNHCLFASARFHKPEKPRGAMVMIHYSTLPALFCRQSMHNQKDFPSETCFVWKCMSVIPSNWHYIYIAQCY
jgi:hypothetical protein